MIITIDTSQPLSQIDLDALMALTGVVAPSPNGQEPPSAPVSVVPTKKAAPAKKAAAPKAEPKPETPAELAADEDEAAKLQETAHAKASGLLADGQRDRVIAALKEIGAARVAEVPADKLQEFIDALGE
jgi:hypothetical protein